VTSLWKFLLAAIALFAAGWLIENRGVAIAEGTGLVVSTLAAGAGWVARELLNERRTRRNISQAFAAVVEARWDDIQQALSDAELARHLKLAAEIAAGREPPSMGARTADPFELLPDFRERIYLFTPGTLRLVMKWRDMATTLYGAYDLLGSRELAAVGPERLAKWFGWVREYRDQYRDVAYTLLLELGRQSDEIMIKSGMLRNAGAKELR